MLTSHPIKSNSDNKQGDNEHENLKLLEDEIVFCQVPYDISKEKLKNPLETRGISQRKCFTYWQLQN